jgi:adenylate cyclase
MVPTLGSQSAAILPGDGRRLIAVVFADMAGYSRLIGLDDAGTFGRLKELRSDLIDPALARHGGILVSTGGDSLMVTFDSIIAAVRFAVDVQRGVPQFDGDYPPDRRVRFRVGVNVGDVIPDGMNLHGEGVNIAARLQTICPPGAICVSRVVRDHVANRLGLGFKELGAVDLKNIARPTEAFLLDLVPPAEPAGRTDWRAGPRRWLRRATWIAAACLLAGALFGSYAWNAGHRPARPRLSIVVLPFENLSNDPGQDYLSDGITEDLTTDLSRVPGMIVIARTSAYSYKGKPEDPRKIGEELDVRYMLEGSVRKLGDTVRVNAQLIATETATHLWADRFDQQLNDLSAGQDEIVRRIGQTLNVALTNIESARSKRERPASPDAFDLMLRAQSISLHPMGPHEQAERLGLYEQALRLDPTSISAMTGVAYSLLESLIETIVTETISSAQPRSLPTQRRPTRTTNAYW